MQLDTQFIIQKLGIQALHPMQLQMLHEMPQHADTLLFAKTGSGKTLAYLLPMLQLIDTRVKHTQAMIVVPSRELALQIDEVCRKLQTGIKITLCYGGHKREIEEQNLIETPLLIIGTAGRLADHIRRKNIYPETIHTLILDEYDKHMELGFTDEISFIVSSLSNIKHKVLVSATGQTALPDFLNINHPHVLSFIQQEDEQTAQREIFYYQAEEADKINALTDLLKHIQYKPTIIFCNHRAHVETVAKKLYQQGLYVSFYHGGMEQRDRESEWSMFKNGTTRILVTTDLAARGLDMQGIRFIIHYHLPVSADVFVHRNGRTARQDDFGTVIVLLGPSEYLPSFMPAEMPLFVLKQSQVLPDKSEWTTLYFSLGKKDKINKIDIVGFLSHIGALKKDDIGLIEVKDFMAFAAVRRNTASETLRLINGQKIKGKKVKVGIATMMVKQFD